MRWIALLVGMLGLVLSGPVWAASYLRVDGVIVDPIVTVGGAVHPYTGINLEPGVYPASASNFGANDNLSGAVLTYADLSGAYLHGLDLSLADLSFADLTYIHEFGSANWDGANLRNADFSYSVGKNGFHLTNVDAANANFLEAQIDLGTNSNFTNASFVNARLRTDFTNAILVGADLTGADMYGDFTGATYSAGSPENRTLFPSGFDPIAAGMVLVPEPTTALLLGLGLVGLAARRRLT